MKPIFQFIRTTITGGILFLLPVVLLAMVVNKALVVLLRISHPIADRLPEIAFGFDGSNMVAIALLIMICFISGLLFRSGLIRRWISSLEGSVLSYLPGYYFIKSLAADALGEKTTDRLVTVMIQDGDSWKIGFLVEEMDGLSTVFIPDAPRHDSGDVIIIPSSIVKRVNIPGHVASKSIKSFGKGAIGWVKGMENAK